MGWIDRRLAQHAHDILVAADGLDHAAAEHPDLSSLEELADAGFVLAERIEMRLASSREMNDWRRLAKEGFLIWAAEYPGELAAYAASHDDPKDQRLLRSMVPRSLR